MKVLVGCFYHETNTFNPQPTHKEDFVFVEGDAVLDRLHSVAALRMQQVDVIPGIYATGLSSGIVTKSTFDFFAQKLLAVLQDTEVDGIWLHLHGSMVVEGIGSGELELIKQIRAFVGSQIPISLTLDIHGNIPEELSQLVNIVRAYRTVPHTDQAETERITAEALTALIAIKETITPAFVKLPVVICGEKALGNREPLQSIFAELAAVEEIEGIATASFFLGHAWSDTAHTGASVFVVPRTRHDVETAEQACHRLVEFIVARKHQFDFASQALAPEQALDYALQIDDKPVFVSDSGDNTTAGAPGCNTVLLKLLTQRDLNGKKAVIASIFDQAAFAELNQHEVGEHVSVWVGGGADDYSEQVLLTGILKAKGDLLGYLNAENDVVGQVCTIEMDALDVVIANRGDSFISINHFVRAGLQFTDYDVIVLKQGYLFDALTKVARGEVLALTPGATYLQIAELNYLALPAAVERI
ncbi:M81 family metallopeptidase [Paenibacillus sp. J2TS4]|uniref:M81 family metallopeptidase n=1 Tax=Paenibacillus sp. J2TS4 TaxID=2807194 RepID=UPI001B253A2F|nr:M81 family metallopeptidase [Paenibacillus sp. J2TS4]GIP36106.1 hypothetical protein J2TS4_53160 [Paenibacillus sp. J2TS4]